MTKNILANIWSEFRNTKEFWKIFVYDCYALVVLIMFLWSGISEIGTWLVDWQMGFDFH